MQLVIDDISTSGGPAFPTSQSRGMSLRDWFAGQALLALAGLAKDLFNDAPTVADVAYHFADAMIAARDKVQP